MDDCVRILHLDDNPLDAEYIQVTLDDAPEGFCASLRYIQTKEEYLAALGSKEKDFDIILSDYRMPGYDGDEALQDARRLCPEIPFIMVTGELGEERAVETLQRGATDYVIKNRLFRLIPAIRRAMAEATREKERRRAEEKLRESEERFRIMADSTPVMIWVTDEQGQIVFVNRAYEEFFGVREEDVKTSGGWRMLVHPDDEKVYAGAYLEAVRNRTPFDAEGRVRHHSGEWRWVHSYGMPRFSGDGRFLGHVGSSPDITGRKLAEEALRESQDRYRSIFHNSHAIMLLIEPETGRILDANPAAAAFYGWGIPELTAMKISDINRSDPAAVRQAIDRARSSSQSFFHFKHRRAGGDSRDVEVFTGPVTVGGRTHLFSIVHDVTRQIQAMEALQESEERMRAIVRNSPFGAHSYRLEPDGRLIFTGANPAADAILGVDNAQFTGKTIEEAFPQLASTDIPEAYRRVAATGIPFTREQVIYDAGDIMGAFELHGFQTGQNQMTVFFTDISERIRAREAISKLNAELDRRVQDRTRQLEVANRELESFSYSISHDLKAPLRVISGFAGLLARGRKGPLTPEQQETLGFIQENAMRMEQLIGALLEFSRLARQELRVQVVDTRQLADEVIAEQLQGMDDETRGRVRVERGELPAVKADPVLLRQVFTNLLANAFKFTRPVSGPVIRIQAREEEDHLRFCVSDNGVGFPSAHAEKLFAVFQRLHGQADFEGTGIGLANVRRIIERHGGRVCADGEEGKGASFYFTLPR